MDIPHLHPDTIEEVQQRVDIIEVISEYVILRQRGKDYVGLCPFHHEKTPSFSVSPHKQLYYCFGCGAGGNTFKFLMEIGKQSFAEVVLDLARRYQIPVKTLEPEKRQAIQRQISLKEQLYEIVAVAASFYEHALRQPQGEVALTYLRSTRQLTDSTVSQFQLGYAPCGWETLYRYLVEQKRYPVNLVEQAGLIKKRKSGNGFYDVFRDRVMIPIADSQGRLIGFGSRIINDQDQPKYLNSPETPLFDKSKTLYALDRAHSTISKEDRAIVVEGYFDAIALHAVGITNVVASLGTALGAYQLKQLIRYTPSKQVILNFDADSAGTKATVRAIKEVEDLVYSGVVQLRILNLPGGKDADEYLNSSDNAVELYQRSLDNAPLWLDWQIDNLLADHNLKTPDGLNQVATGMVKLLNQLQDANQRNYYLSYCAELLSQGDARLIAQNLATLRAQLPSKTRRKAGKYGKKQNNRSFSTSKDTSKKSLAISQSNQSPLTEAGKTELPSATSVSSQLSEFDELSLPSLASENHHSAIQVAVNPETELLEQAESLLLRIYIHCPRYREEIVDNLEEKDLLFSLPHHRFLWQQIIESEALIPQKRAEDNNPLLTELHNRSLDFSDMMQKVNHLLHLNETTQEDLSRTSTLIENAIASLELVVCEKYKLYCTKQIQNLDPRTDAKYLYYCQELQQTEKRIKELEKMRYFTQNSQY
ncbi:MAG: DNA primase [Xenococcaceae cyanobacterium MO_188.B29]|nr:DNA primase [Xenococcaceae cyanobacterium MO_188.B29]